MSAYFEPRLDLLPRARREIWSSLAPLVGLNVILYGGTAVALRLGHRQSLPDVELKPGLVGGST